MNPRLYPLAGVLLGLLALAVPQASAQCSQAAYQQQHVVQTATTYHAQAVVSAVTPVEVAVYNPYAVLVPSYAGFYSGGNPQQQQPASMSPEALELLRQMAGRIDGVESYLRGTGGMTAPLTPMPQQPPPPALPPPPPLTPKPGGATQGAQGAGRTFTSCVRCHGPTTADEGGGHVLLDASGALLATLDGGELVDMVDRLTRDPSEKGAMPKGANIPSEEVTAMIAAIKLQARQAGKKQVGSGGGIRRRENPILTAKN